MDVVWAYAGVRPLYDDGASEAKAADARLCLRVRRARVDCRCFRSSGGKITTYRRLSEEALERLEKNLPGKAKPAGWTGTTPLPGGDLDVSRDPGARR